jgi:hypothetical protein
VKNNREIDKLIAEKIMNLENVRYQKQGYHWDLVYGPNKMAGVASLVPFYSTDMNDAFKVVEVLEKKRITLELTRISEDLRYKQPGPSVWFARFLKCFVDTQIFYPEVAETESAAEAICLAALKIIKGIKRKE